MSKTLLSHGWGQQFTENDYRRVIPTTQKLDQKQARHNNNTDGS